MGRVYQGLIDQEGYREYEHYDRDTEINIRIPICIPRDGIWSALSETKETGAFFASLFYSITSSNRFSVNRFFGPLWDDWDENFMILVLTNRSVFNNKVTVCYAGHNHRFEEAVPSNKFRQRVKQDLKNFLVQKFG